MDPKERSTTQRLMAEVIATYTSRVTGVWNTRHTISNADEELGVLTIERNGKGMIVRGTR